MKAKYKVGQFVEAQTGSGRITGVLMDESGISYKTGSGLFIMEKEVTQAYNPIIKTVRRKRRTTATAAAATPVMDTAVTDAVDML